MKTSDVCRNLTSDLKTKGFLQGLKPVLFCVLTWRLKAPPPEEKTKALALLASQAEACLYVKAADALEASLGRSMLRRYKGAVRGKVGWRDELAATMGKKARPSVAKACCCGGYDTAEAVP